jgi:hypothetical protein
MFLALFGAPSLAEERMSRINAVQVAYLEHCGGCHGIQGVSAPQEVPDLAGQVGSFLCTPAGRAYLVRLPNVALAPISDQVLADVMNFVVFQLGGAVANQRTPLYTEEEVVRLRGQPLTDTGLAAYRAKLVAELIERCGAPRSLGNYTVRRSQ